MYSKTDANNYTAEILPTFCLNHLRVLVCTVLIGLITLPTAFAQPLGNEWIDYTKTYYKIPITTAVVPSAMPGNHINKGDYNTLYRITYGILDSLSLKNVPAEDFQLWRNGEEIPLYVTKPTGLLSATDYIEFWGEANDGKPDNQLFRDTASQANNKWSFFSDTAIHFLTVNPGGNNARIIDVVNNPLLSTLSPDAYFMHNMRISPKQYRYMGYGVQIQGTTVRSSSFDLGEGWGFPFSRGGGAEIGLNNLPLNEYKQGPLITLKYSISGESDQSRDISVSIYNGSPTVAVKDSVVDTKRFRRFIPETYTVNNIPYSRIDNRFNFPNVLRFNFTNGPYDGGDQMFLLGAEFTYARTFNFSKTEATTESSFVFSLPANPLGNLFDITAPGLGLSVPYIIDLTNRKKYTGIKKDALSNTYAFELDASVTDRKLVFISGNTKDINYKEIIDTAAGKTISKPFPVKFRDFSKPEAQADYVIISNSKLFNADGVNYVDQYRQYRNSQAGGAFNTKVYDIDSLADQFGYGIRRSPLAIRNFVRYAKAKFANPIKNVFLIGRGVTYNSYPLSNTGGAGGNIVSNNGLEALNLVPTWGEPASDNMLVAPDDNKTSTPQVPIGRLAAINGAEIKNYLDKVKEYEQLQTSPETAAWQKNTIHLIGGSDTIVLPLIKSYMSDYKAILEDTLAGAKVNTFIRANDPNTASNNIAVQQLVNNGTGLVTYFGHSSPTSIDFTLNNPNELSNTAGKYPVFMFDGCSAAQFYTASGPRLSGEALTLAEKFVLAKEKGTIAFMSSSSYGILQYLGPFTKQWYRSAGITKYGKGLGEILQNTIRLSNNANAPTDFYNRVTTEEYILHADPAIKLYSISKPDYEIDSTSITASPSHVTMATDSVTITTTIYNKGKAVGDSVWFHLERILPDGTLRKIYENKIPAFGYSKTITATIPIIGVNQKGENYIRAVVDSLSLLDEDNENNNGATLPLFIFDNELTPVIPYQYSIVHNTSQPIRFVGSTVNPLAESISYRFQIDTTTKFNSPLLKSKDETVTGSVVEFNHELRDMPDSTVYYWRLSPITAGVASNWTSSSFTYLSGSSDGFDQSHYYQHLKSTFSNIKIDSISRQFVFDSTHNHIYIDQGIYRTSGVESIQFSLAANGLVISQGACIGSSIIFNVFDSLNFEPWENTPSPNGRFGSTTSNCYKNMKYNFEFKYHSYANRKKIMDFLDSVPKGMFVAARMNLDPDPGQSAFPGGKADSSFSTYWMRDTTIFGSGKSLYHSFIKQGFFGVEGLNTTPHTFGLVFKKDDTLSFKPQYTLSEGLYDRVTMGVLIPMQDTAGSISSPMFGPATKWRDLHWRNKPILLPIPDDGQSDNVTIQVYGIDTAGVETKLKDFEKSVKDTSIEDIDAAVYPYLRLKMITSDPKKGTPQQLDYWRLNYDPIPEGAISSADYYNFTKDPITLAFKDTLDKGIDTLHFGVAFKNISAANFKDSVAVEVRLTSPAGNTTYFPIKRLKKLNAGDTLHFNLELLTDTLMEGSYTLFVNFNPNRLQSEEFANNNFMYKSFFVNVSPDGTVDSVGYFDFTRKSTTQAFKDTLTVAKDTLHFGISFKNISPFAFKDSILATVSIIPDGGTAIATPMQTLKPLLPGDTLHLNYDSTTATLTEGWHTIIAAFNPGMAQQEKTLSNNTFSHRFYMYSLRDTASFFNFTAKLQADSVLLNWAATNEINYDNYTVEYSTDNLTFNTLGSSFQSQHNTPPSSYTYTHKNPVPDTNYYRIKITRKNGSVFYSLTRIIVIPVVVPPITAFKVRVVPNPFHEKLIIYVENPDATEAVPAMLVNAAGQVVRKFTLQAYNDIKTSLLPAGSYWLIVFHGKEKIPFRLEKI